ncbi:MAG: hypothetical protein RLY70_3412, partial [Planctomycetota bacterium]
LIRGIGLLPVMNRYLLFGADPVLSPCERIAR